MGNDGCMVTALKWNGKEMNSGYKAKISVGIYNMDIYFNYKSVEYSHKSISHTGIGFQNIKKGIMKDLDLNAFF